MLKFEHITIAFDDVPILYDFNYQVDKGDFVILEGTNGSGKSTLFDLISGKIKPSSGKIFLDGEDMTHYPEMMRSSLISRMSQNTMLGCFPSMTLEENLVLAATKNRLSTLENGQRSFIRQKLVETLSPLGFAFEALLKKPMGKLSGGQRQILTFIMATLTTPKLLLLDEPTAALDPASAELLIQLASDYVRKHNLTTMLITHDTQLASSYGNRKLTLKR